MVLSANTICHLATELESTKPSIAQDIKAARIFDACMCVAEEFGKGPACFCSGTLCAELQD